MTAGPRTPFLTKTGFPPLIDETARILVLGTLPGEESFRRQEYYGHPRNQFWRILADVYHVPVAENYPERVALLRQKQTGAVGCAAPRRAPGQSGSGDSECDAE